jgi:hypothetical protein
MFELSQRQQTASPNTNRLMLFGEIIVVYCENRKKHLNRLCGQNAKIFNVKAGGTYCALCGSCAGMLWCTYQSVCVRSNEISPIF